MDSALGGGMGDLPRQVHVASGDPAGIVRRECHLDLRICEQHIRMMVRLLGQGADCYHQIRAALKGLRREAGRHLITFVGPAVQAGSGDLISGKQFHPLMLSTAVEA